MEPKTNRTALAVQHCLSATTKTLTPALSLKGEGGKIDVFSIEGQLVENLFESNLGSGTHEIQWNAGNKPQGVYYFKVETGNSKVYVRRMIIMK